MRKGLLYILILIGLTSCNMEKEIDLDLPDYEAKMVVECYLEPGQPYRLSLFESVSYFQDPQLPPIEKALVTITFNGITDTLKYNPFLDVNTGKLYNYHSTSIVPLNHTLPFSLYIRDSVSGRIITGETKIPVPPAIDTVEFKYDEDSSAFALTSFYDISSSEDNYYRYIVNKNSFIVTNTDYQFDDQLNTTSKISVGGNNNLNKGDSVIVTLYHLNVDYFNYLESVDAAIDANVNPFGQPATIKSNINGGLGIFTGLCFDRVYTKVP